MASVASMCGKRISLHEREFDYNDFIGVEQELENIPRMVFNGVTGVSTTNDGSLRGDSCEVVTEVMPASKMRFILQAVESVAREWMAEEGLRESDVLNERTSTHIHLNMSDVDIEDVKNMVMVYMAIEPHLFATKFADRESNRFCTPLYTMGAINPLTLRSSKYQALNLKTLSRFGTVEFRHMGGCLSTEEIVDWAKLILRMKHIAISKSREELLHLIDTGHVFDLVFGVGTEVSEEHSRLGKFSVFSRLGGLS